MRKAERLEVRKINLPLGLRSEKGENQSVEAYEVLPNAVPVELSMTASIKEGHNSIALGKVQRRRYVGN